MEQKTFKIVAILIVVVIVLGFIIHGYFEYRDEQKKKVMLNFHHFLINVPTIGK